MNSLQTFHSSESSTGLTYQPKNPFAKVPIKFKAIILTSLFNKHRQKELNCLKNAFFTWYIQKNDNQMLKDYIDRLLIAQKQSKFTASRFFYRMKFTIRKQLSSNNQSPSPSDESKQKSSNSEIKEQQYCAKKNFTDYFESLKNIFSMKLIECQKELNSSGLIGKNGEMDLRNQEKRFKTEGCEVGTSVDESFTNMNKFSAFEEKEKEMEKEIKEKENIVKEIGKKVALTLVKSFIVNFEKTSLLIGFVQIAKKAQMNKSSQQSQLVQTECLKQLSLMTKQSSQIPIQTQPLSFTFSPSHSFIQTPCSSSTSLPPLAHINNQISHVQYSLNILSQTIKKDNELQELYQEFHSQFGEFESIEKDFQVLRIKTRNSLFDRLVNVRKNIQKWLVKEAFDQLISLGKRKQHKSNTENLSRSRVNIETLHEIFSKPLIPLSSKLPAKQDFALRSQMDFQMTSIKVICDRTNKTETNFYKPTSRGGIKKQTFRQDVNTSTNQVNNQLCSTFGSNFKDQPTGATQNKKSGNSTPRNHNVVNFAIPKSESSKQSSEFSSDGKKSEMLIESMKDGFRKKTQNKMNSTGGFYQLSMKSFGSNASSSPSTKYHAQLKSQYWWNDMEQKENFMDRERIIDSKSSLGNQQ